MITQMAFPTDQSTPGQGEGTAALRGSSAAMMRLQAQILRVAPTDATVMISGESGTGKELVAHALHQHSRRASQPFVPVNCGAIAPTLIEAQLLGHEKGSFTGADRSRIGYFEQAHGGTLFLDEVTEIPPAIQVKLLRVLESRQFNRVGGSETIRVDVRVIASTNRNLLDATRSGTFREDLLYRLAVFPLRLPPLRERETDAVELANHFLDELNRRESTEKSFSRQALAQIGVHSWPGNIRELKNAVSRAFILADGIIELQHLGGFETPVAPEPRDGAVEIVVGTSLAQAHQALILATLENFKGDNAATARTLGISVKTLLSRMDMYRRSGR